MITKKDSQTPKLSSKKSGVREIAKRADIAPMTVSPVLSNSNMVSAQTCEKILKTIDQANFVPNRLVSSMRGNGRMISAIVPPLINSGIAEQV